MFRLLHLSDLHRYSEDHLDNDVMLNGIVTDLDRAATTETPPIGPPDAAIITGDLVSGILAPGQTQEVGLREQYAEAFAFLASLTAELFNGDRAKVVVLPGNHDADWTISDLAMTEEKTEADPRSLLGNPAHGYRWDWKRRRLLRISDFDIYNKRMWAYRELRCLSGFDAMAALNFLGD